MGESGDLERLALARFALLSESEIKLLSAAPTGDIAFCGASNRDDDPGNDPRASDNWDAARLVRSELIRWLCTDKGARDCVDPRGIQLHGARIDGKLDLSFVIVPFPLRLLRCRVSDDLNFNYIEIPAIHLTGTCVPSLSADHARVKGSVFLREGFRSEGQVKLRGAQLGGNLDCEGGEFRNPAKAKIASIVPALDAEGIKVAGSILLRRNPLKEDDVPFLAQGGVRLFRADVGGNLECDGGRFQNGADPKVTGSGMAIEAEAIKVGGVVLFRKGFCATGCVRLFRAEIGGNLECDGGTFKNATNAEIPESGGASGRGVALSAEGAKIDGSAFLRNDFSADGQVRLFGARIERTLECNNVTFQNPAFTGLDLRGAFAGRLIDDLGSWPPANKLFIDGFVYGGIAGGPLDASKRLEWVNRQALFARQPYRQLAHVLNEAGDDKGGRQVLSEMQRRVWEERGWYARPLSYLLRFTIGYGYFPLRAVWLLLALIVTGSIVYLMGYSVGNIVPTDKEAYAAFESRCEPPNYYPRFNPVVYSLENSFPLVKLGIQDKWAPAPGPQAAACLHPDRSQSHSAITASEPLRWFRWGQICIGWVLTTLFVAGVTGILRKN